LLLVILMFPIRPSKESEKAPDGAMFRLGKERAANPPAPPNLVNLPVTSKAHYMEVGIGKPLQERHYSGGH
jgi:hypothetical protein